MEVILLQDVEKLGYKDDVVSVKPGYGRNLLIPSGKAKLATPGNLKNLEEIKKQRSFKDQRMKDEAEKSAAKLKEMTVKVGAKAGESGKIFGSVNTIQIAEALRKLGLDIDRKNISLPADSIKQLGSYTASLRLHREVIVDLDFEVVEE